MGVIGCIHIYINIYGGDRDMQGLSRISVHFYLVAAAPTVSVAPAVSAPVTASVTVGVQSSSSSLNCSSISS